MSAPRVLAIFALFAGLNSCSLVLDDIDLTCRSQDDCHALNRAYGLDDGPDGACEIYQCRDDRRGCEKKARDLDGDRSADEKTCAGKLDGPLDCDDGDPASRPGNDEVCDGNDNDCDESIDEQVLAANLKRVPATDIARADRLSMSESSDAPLSLVVTTDVGAYAHTILRTGEQEETTQSQLQSDLVASANCTKSGDRSVHCTLRDIAIATSGDALIALGIQTSGCDVGSVRLASRLLQNEEPPYWDGDSFDSNLKEGVLRDPVCPAAPGGARAPRLAILSGRAGERTEALALWRAASGVAPGELVALGLTVDARPSAAPRLNAIDGPHGLSFSGPELGQDPAALRAFRDGFLVAYDNAQGLELAFISDLAGGPAAAFERAERLKVPRPGARAPTLAGLSSGTLAEAQGLAVAWRSDERNGSAIHFAPIALHAGKTAAFEHEIADITLASGIQISEGPALVYARSGFTHSPARGQGGGWVVLWIEQQAGTRKLMAVRVAAWDVQTIEAPFELFADAALKHLFAFAESEHSIGYGIVSADNAQQLNMGSLVCRE